MALDALDRQRGGVYPPRTWFGAERVRGMSQRYETLLEYARDIILFIGEGGRIVGANRAAAAAYGYELEQLVGLRIGDLRAEETRPEIAAQIARAIREGLLFETVHKRKDGSVFPVEVSSKSAEFGDTMLISVIRDITERKRAEDELRRAKDDLEARIAERTWELDKANAALRDEVIALEKATSMIASQAAELLDRSVLVLPLRKDLLFSPLVGPLDAARVALLSERLLQAVAERSARCVVLDVTGVSALDEGAVQGLFQVVSAVKLVGAEVLVTGMRAAAAKELMRSGIEIGSLATYATLERGLEVALRRLG